MIPKRRRIDYRWDVPKGMVRATQTAGSIQPGVSDSAHYGGTNVGNTGEIDTLMGPVPELNLTVPPLAAIFLVPES
jgi:hypothetical protein